MKYNKEEIKEWINIHLFDKKGHLNKIRCARNGEWVYKYYTLFYNSILELTDFLDHHYREVYFSQRIWHILNDVFHVVRCNNCSEPVKFKVFSRGYPEFCNQRCYKDNPETAVEKIKQVKLEKYGDENYNNKEKTKNTKKKRYGDEKYNNMEKTKKTNRERYGAEIFPKTHLFREKIKNYGKCKSSRPSNWTRMWVEHLTKFYLCHSIKIE